MKLKFNKQFWIFVVVATVIYFHWSINKSIKSITPEYEVLTTDELLLESYTRYTRKKPGMKYILQWTLPNTIPFVYWGYGQDEFIRRKCKVNKCFVTPDKYFLKSREFDLVAFHGPEIAPLSKAARARVTVPKHVHKKQKYVFVSIESPKNYPVCDKKYDGYFNWTWTYKLDSDVPYEYIAIKNIDGDIIGPKQNMKWIKIDLMEPINGIVKERLKTKKKAAAWFASNCNALSKRGDFASELQFELQNYNLQLDVFGECGKNKCSRDKMNDCLKMIERDYYFYLAFENTFADDYVTEKLLLALQHYAVPVVFGGANYTRVPYPKGENGNPIKVHWGNYDRNLDELSKQQHFS